MTSHSWQTYQRTDHKQHDECERCDAVRWKGVNTGWKWHFVVGGETCPGAGGSSPDERAMAMEGRE